MRRRFWQVAWQTPASMNRNGFGLLRRRNAFSTSSMGTTTTDLGIEKRALRPSCSARLLTFPLWFPLRACLRHRGAAHTGRVLRLAWGRLLDHQAFILRRDCRSAQSLAETRRRARSDLEIAFVRSDPDGADLVAGDMPIPADQRQ